MTRDETPEANAPKFRFKHVPFARISRQISEGLAASIDPAELAAEIRKHGAEKMPPDVVDFLCGHLEGKIERRGRRGDTDTEKREIARTAKLFYSMLSMAEAKDPDTPQEALELYDTLRESVAEGYAPYETRWRMVSRLLYGHPGHSRSLANRVSEYFPLS